MPLVSIVPLEELTASQRWDAEAFAPFLRSLDRRFATYPQLRELATVTHASEIARLYTDAPDGIPFLLAQNIRPILPDLTETARIPPETAANIPINRLHHADVLVARSGVFNACVYLGDTGKCYTSGEGLIVRAIAEIDGAYLTVFLNTNVGLALCQRCLYGSGQPPHLSPKYLGRIRVPRLGKIEEIVSCLVREANSLIQDASSLYPEAEAELLERIGWKELGGKPDELYYTEDFETLSEHERIDAEYYQPKYKRLCDRLRKVGAKRIGDFSPEPQRGVQPVFCENGQVFVIDSKAVRPHGVEPSKTECTDSKFFNSSVAEKGRVVRDDVLLNSTGRGTLGRASFYDSDAPALADNHVAIIRPDRKTCLPSHLSLFLNSPAGLAQSEMFQTGSSGQLEMYPQHIQQILVYIPQTKTGKVDLAWQEKLADKIKAAANAKVAAQAKLEEAKRLVEQAIAKGEQQEAKKPWKSSEAVHITPLR